MNFLLLVECSIRLENSDWCLINSHFLPKRSGGMIISIIKEFHSNVF